MLYNLSSFLENIILNSGVYAPLIASLLIIVESILPVLPLCLFITINFFYFGNLCGFLISWSFTCLGCILSYYLVKYGFQTWRYNENKEKQALTKCIKYISGISLPKFIMIIALPFTPAFLINIACGLCNMPFKKFIFAILVGKIFMVYFWGYIGTSFLESLQNPIIILKVIIMLIIAYIIGYIINKIDNNPFK